MMDMNSRASKSPPIDKNPDFFQMSSSHNKPDNGNLEQKKDLMIKLLKTNKLLEKYVALKKTNSDEPQFKQKLKEKIPQFEYAIKKLALRKNECKFNSQGHSDNQTFVDKNFTMVLNSTVNDNSYGFRVGGEKSFNNTTCNESFNKSVKSLLNSMKTDNLSRKSDQNYLKELKQNTIAENEKLFQEKLESLNALLRQLKE